MELFDHLGIWPDQNPTLRSIYYKIRGLFILYNLGRLLLVYHIVSAGLSVVGILVPIAAESTKRQCGEWFWTTALHFLNLDRVNISVTGDQILPESAIVICNHQSLADHLLIVYLSRTCGTIHPQANFFTWYSLWRVPTIKTLLNMFRCDENWELSKSWTDLIFKRVITSEAPEWIVLFPEVNIFTPATSYLQNLQSEKYYLPKFTEVLYPRFSGLQNASRALNITSSEKFSKLYDLSISYSHKVSLLAIFSNAKSIEVKIHVRARNLNRFPQKRAKIEKWLEKVWIEKEKQVHNMSFQQDQPSGEILSVLDMPLTSIATTSSHLASNGWANF